MAEEQLRAAEDLRLRCIKALANRKYPIVTLPPEITSEIFIHFNVPPLSAKTSPSLLSQVCGQWRLVAMTLPKLWSTFQVHHSLSENQLALLNAFLERSQRCLLSISIDNRRLRRSAC
ncbi:hypothetical protein B0H14DRAFT_2421126 [Mycena olivaceomarginata]|nr:hypothetical protein B0H14DRAFT_2421126 [Mycena olivaceomarginata]